MKFIKMRTLISVLLSCMCASQAMGLTIESFNSKGQLVFSPEPGVESYCVEWAASVNGPWTNSWKSLAGIIPAGEQSVTCSVPMYYRIKVNIPEGMQSIPEGRFVMGAMIDADIVDALPVKTNMISAFYMDTYEVTKAKWDGVYNWAITNGYTFDNPGTGKASNHPVYEVTWYDCVKWANARSEQEGLSTCYTVSNEIYRSGVHEPACDWTADGYRLPTEAEWEKATRGGTYGMRFPWTDSDIIVHARANYLACSDWYTYDSSPTTGYHPDYYINGETPCTAPVGTFEPNGYGLYNMAGNIWEWCWDWYAYGYGAAAQQGANPHGPATGTERVKRGGVWSNSARRTRNAYRDHRPPDSNQDNVGFRLVRITP